MLHPHFFAEPSSRSGPNWRTGSTGLGPIPDSIQYVEFSITVEDWGSRKEGVSSKRWLAPWKNSGRKPAIYHCI